MTSFCAARPPITYRFPCLKFPAAGFSSDTSYNHSLPCDYPYISSFSYTFVFCILCYGAPFRGFRSFIYFPFETGRIFPFLKSIYVILFSSPSTNFMFFCPRGSWPQSYPALWRFLLSPFPQLSGIIKLFFMFYHPFRRPYMPRRFFSGVPYSGRSLSVISC